MRTPSPRKILHLGDGECTSGTVGNALNMSYSIVSEALSYHDAAPPPIRNVGRVRIYSQEAIDNWIASFGTREEAKAKINTLASTKKKQREKKAKKRMRRDNEPVAKDVKKFNALAVGFLTMKLR